MFITTDKNKILLNLIEFNGICKTPCIMEDCYIYSYCYNISSQLLQELKTLGTEAIRRHNKKRYTFALQTAISLELISEEEIFERFL